MANICFLFSRENKIVFFLIKLTVIDSEKLFFYFGIDNNGNWSII